LATANKALAFTSMVWLLAACARSGVEAPPLPVLSSGGPSSTAILGPGTRALDDVRQPLDRLGFTGGRERVYAGAAGSFERTVTRALAFGSPDGASAYLEWLAGHAEAVLGAASAVSAPVLGADAVAFEHRPGDCCPGKDVPAYLIAWRNGSVVLVVETRGKAMELERAVSVATALERAA
jgi:hypothetical protein